LDGAAHPAIAAGQHAQRQAASGVPAKASAGINAQIKATRTHPYASRALIEQMRGRPNMRLSYRDEETEQHYEFYFSTEGQTNEFSGSVAGTIDSRANYNRWQKGRC
jgi:hypothetical protein